jgi:hypothetical protein
MKYRFWLIFITLSILLIPDTYPQHLGAYIDYMGRFYVFDNGENQKIEDFKPQSFKVGGKVIMYINDSGHLKIYYDGKTRQLEPGGVSENNYFATDYLGIYSIFEKLKVIHKGKIIELSHRCTTYQAQDSLVAFYDKNQESLRVFYKGVVQDIESGMMGYPITKWKSADNIVAYISSRTKDFKIWYRGEVFLINKNVEETHFKVGADIVAYVDPLDETFKAFYKGEIYELNDFAPQSFEMGDMFVAFVDHMGDFKYFSNGEITKISTITPDGYLAEDYCLAYIEDGRFKMWYNNESIEIEAWIPSVYKLDWNTMAYLDNSNRIWIFQNGDRKFFSNELINSFEIYRDLIQMNVKVNRNIIYYQDQFYEGESLYK